MKHLIHLALTVLLASLQMACGDLGSAPVNTASRVATTEKAGTLLSAEPMTAYLTPGVPLPAKAWRVRYRSTTATGAANEVTGVVLVPNAAYAGGGTRPLIGYAIGTQGMADRCAASRQLADGSEYEAGLIGEVLSQGWVVALTDYPGLGTPGDHPYVVGRALGPAVLDIMRAARQLPETGLNADGPAALIGYSEGGNAAAWAAELQPAYAPDLKLAAIAVGGIPADLERQAAFSDGTPTSWLQIWAAIGLDTAYPELRLRDALNARGQDFATRYNDLCLQEAIAIGAADALTASHRSSYLTTDVLQRADWRQRMRENRLGGNAQAAPVLMQHAPYDEAVAYAPDRTLYDEWCALGVNARFQDVPGEHLTGGITAMIAAVRFVSDRFAGLPLGPACQP